MKFIFGESARDIEMRQWGGRQKGRKIDERNTSVLKPSDKFENFPPKKFLVRKMAPK